jgi:hypothetical protein
MIILKLTEENSTLGDKTNPFVRNLLKIAQAPFLKLTYQLNKLGDISKPLCHF